MKKLTVVEKISQVLCLFAITGGLASPAQGGLTWDPGANSTDGSAHWGQTTPNNWWNGTLHSQPYVNTTPGSDVIFGWNSGTPGTVTLDAAMNVNSFTFNPFTGIYTFDAASAYIISLKGNLTMNSGAGAVTYNANAKLTLTGDSTLDNESASALTIGSILAGNYNLTKTGPGTLTLSGANTFGAGKTFTLGAGTLNINTNAALGSATTTNQINGGTTINNTSGAAILTVNANPLTINGDFTFAGGGTGTDHDLSFKAAATTLGTAAGTNRTITVTAANSTLEIKGVITNGTTANALTKTGNGALTLSGASTFSGGVTLNAGTLNINKAGVAGTSGPLGNGGPFTINGGTIDNTSGAAISTLNVNPITIGSNLAFSTSAGTSLNNLTLPGPVSLGADRTITLNGAGALTLSGALTNTGDSARTLTVTNGGAATTFGSLTLGGYALTGAGSTAGRTNTINGNGNVTISGIVSDGVSAGCSLTYSGSGALTLMQTNTFTGNLNVLSGTVACGANMDGGLGGGTIRLGDTVGNSSATLMGYSNGSVNNDYANPIRVVGGNSGLATISKTTGNGAGTANFMGLVTLENHDLTVSNDFGALLALQGGITTSMSGLRTISVSGSANVQLGANAGVITDGNGQIRFVQNGSGILYFCGANTFTGDVLINSGTVAQGVGSGGNSANFGTNNTIFIGAASGSANATLDFWGNGGVTIANNITVRGGGANALNAVVGNPFNTSTGLLTLNADLTVNYAVVGSGGIIIGSTTNGTYLTGSKAITSLNSGTNGTSYNALSGNNPGFTGNVTVGSGILKVNSATALSSANIVAIDSYSNPPTFNLNGYNQTIAGLSDGPNGGGTVTNTGVAKTLTLGGNGAYSFSGSIGATNLANLAMTVALTGGGTQALGGTNTFTGATTVNSGILLVNGSLASTSVTVNAGATLGGSGILAGTTIVKTNGILAPGVTGTAGTLTVSNLALQAGAVYNWKYGVGASDSVAVLGTLSLPAVATVNVTRVNGKLPQTVQLFTTPNSVSANLSGWVIRGDGTTGGRISSAGNNVVLSFPYHGTAVFFR